MTPSFVSEVPLQSVCEPNQSCAYRHQNERGSERVGNYQWTAVPIRAAGPATLRDFFASLIADNRCPLVGQWRAKPRAAPRQCSAITRSGNPSRPGVGAMTGTRWLDRLDAGREKDWCVAKPAAVAVGQWEFSQRLVYSNHETARHNGCLARTGTECARGAGLRTQWQLRVAAIRGSRPGAMRRALHCCVGQRDRRVFRSLGRTHRRGGLKSLSCRSAASRARVLPGA
jgi:hypothetical protein